jgi:thiamine pyrophosphokinase
MNRETRRCVLISAYLDAAISEIAPVGAGDFVICLDGGYARAAAEGLVPDVVLGDFDSLKSPVDPGFKGRIIRAPAEKDDTDAMLGLKYGLELGFSDFLMIGGLGGRLDHSLANLQALSFCLDQGGRMWVADAANKATIIADRSFTLRREEKEGAAYFSLLSWTERCTGVCVENAKYTLRNAVLTQGMPLGVSNEFLEGPAVVRLESGRLLVILSRD